MKKMFKSLLALSVLSMSLVPAFATNWVRIGTNHYIDSDSIRPSANYGTYTMKTRYLTTAVPLETINGRDIYEIKTNSFVDCTSNYAKTVSYSAYDNNGRLVTTGRNVGKQWYNINNPGSRAYESYAFVCTDKYLDSWAGYDNLWMY